MKGVKEQEYRMDEVCIYSWIQMDGVVLMDDDFSA